MDVLCYSAKMATLPNPLNSSIKNKNPVEQIPIYPKCQYWQNG